MSALRFVLGFIAFLAVYGFTDWFAGVTAPVLGPAFLVGLIVLLIWTLYRLSKVGK